MPGKGSLNPGGVKVRELWVSNLPYDVTKDQIYTIFFVYGEIEKIEIITVKGGAPYAFVRFLLTSCTSRAIETNGTEIDGHKMKVMFSDSSKRPEILGDTPNYDLTY
jgi:RNA recognition motif-containing protein